VFETEAFPTLTEAEWDRVQGIWDLMDEGRLDAARLELRSLMSKRPGHPDLRIVDASLAIEEGDPRHALEALHGAERSADPAVYFHLRGLARHDLLDFEGAREDGEQALLVRPDMPEAHDLLSRVLEHLGDDEAARAHAEEASGLDPEDYPPPLEVSGEEFDAIVERSIRELPEAFRAKLDEIPVFVEPLPRREILEGDDPPLAPDLLGLFVGHSLLERSHLDPGSLPAGIYLFRRNLLRSCHTREELAREIRITVQHEVGHLLGYDEDDLDRLGLA
jgi:predicted Zn-dependent protease with MMP-like domain